MPLDGQPLVVHALRSAAQGSRVSDVVVIAPRGHLEEMCQAVAGASTPAHVSVGVVLGGAERADSVAAGLDALPVEVGIVVVHDAARALTPVEVFDRVVGAVRAGHSAVVPAVPVTDTIKQVTPVSGIAAPGEESAYPGVGEFVTGTIDRTDLRAAQTPQGFLRETLARAHDQAASQGVQVTDDAGMVEAAGGHVFAVPGDARAFKITTAQDLALARLLIGAP